MNGVGCVSARAPASHAGFRDSTRSARASAWAVSGAKPGYGCAAASPTIPASAARSANAPTSGHHARNLSNVPGQAIPHPPSLMGVDYFEQGSMEGRSCVAVSQPYPPAPEIGSGAASAYFPAH